MRLERHKNAAVAAIVLAYVSSRHAAADYISWNTTNSKWRDICRCIGILFDGDLPVLPSDMPCLCISACNKPQTECIITYDVMGHNNGFLWRDVAPLRNGMI